MTEPIPQIKIRCPVCREATTWRDNPHRPFCSEHCRAQDLGNWAMEKYRIPTHESPEAEETPTKDGDKTPGDTEGS